MMFRLPTAIGALFLAALSGCGAAKDIDTGGPSGSSDVDVFINEFMTDNASALQDNGTFPDWIELYNAGSETVDLAGFWMTDDLSDIFNWQIPDGVTVGAGQYVVIFADDDTEQGEYHASFQLDQLGGEDIGLFGLNVDDNPLIDSVSDFGLLAEDESLARQPDGSDNWQPTAAPTPGVSNGG